MTTRTAAPAPAASALPAAPLAELRHVSKVFTDPGGRERTVLQDISLAVPSGQVVCVLGPSGCGKSTILRILIGLAPATSGEVLSHGAPLLGVHPGAALVFQSFALYPWLTVAENVRVGLYSKQLGRTEEEQRIAEALHKVGLEGFEDAFPKELSGGMKQRVGIARALVGRPELLCLDEPFSALDVMTAEALRAELYRLWSEGKSGLKSVLMITHIIEEAVYLGDRIVLLDANPGRIHSVIENPLPHPREYRDPAFQELVGRIHDEITARHLPDVPGEEKPATEPRVVPLPTVTLGRVVGLTEVLNNQAGSMNLFDLDAMMEEDFGETIAVVKAAEQLGWVETPADEVRLTADGRRFVAAEIPGRKAMLADRLRNIGLFRVVLRLLEAAPEHTAAGHEVFDAVMFRLPWENPQRLIDTVRGWGRYAGLWDYDSGRDEWSLREPDRAEPAD